MIAFRPPWRVAAPHAAAWATLVASLAMVLAIAAADQLTGYETRLAILQLVPIALATWRLGGLVGALVALSAAAGWLLSFESSHPYSAALYFYWEGAVTGCTYLIVVVLLARLRSALARSDARLAKALEEARRARELIDRHRDAAHRTARLAALGEFASAIAHELNQPLAAIATYNNACLRLLEKDRIDVEELRGAMSKCRDQARRAGAIIQRLREVLRQPQAARSAQDLNEVARAALQLAEPEALQAGVRLELAAAQPLPRVRADGLLIEQVALNLLRNAIEAVEGLPPERRRVSVATGVDPQGRVRLSVSDLGEGVRGEARERLFDAFVTTKPGGLGLGLSICRSVIEAHGGSIAYEPNDRGGEPRGARFAFAIPAEAA